MADMLRSVGLTYLVLATLRILRLDFDGSNGVGMGEWMAWWKAALLRTGKGQIDMVLLAEGEVVYHQVDHDNDGDLDRFPIYLLVVSIIGLVCAL